MKKTLRIAVPLTCSELVLAANTFIAVFMVAKLGAVALAASALVNSVYLMLAGICWGIITAIGVMVAHHYGANNPQGVRRVVHVGALLSVFLSLPIMFLMWQFSPLLRWLHEPAATIVLAQRYMDGLLWAIIPDFLGFVLQQYVVGVNRPRLVFVFNGTVLPINVLLNYLLIDGYWGLPRLGIAGIGWGTAISFWLVMVVMMLYVAWDKKLRQYTMFHWRNDSWQWHTCRELWRLGWPIGVTFGLEIGSFTLMTFLIGHFGVSALAAQQIVLQYLNVTVMIAFGISQATTIRTGHLLGAGNVHQVGRAGIVGMQLAALGAILVGLVYWLIPHTIIAVDLDPALVKNAEVVTLAISYFAIAGCFQITDSIRIIAIGALRGMRDTRYPMWISALAFWGLGLSLGWACAVGLHLGGMGYWLGMFIAITLAMGILIRRFQHKVRVIVAEQS